MAAFEPVRLSAGQLSTEVLPWGLTVYSLLLDGLKAGPRDLLIGPKTPALENAEGPEGRAFRAQTIGRYANRLDNAAVRTYLGDRAGQRWAKDGVTLHGGEDGLDLQTFDTVPLGSSILFKDSAAGDSQVFRYASARGQQGLPASVLVEARVSLESAAKREVEDAAGRKSIGSLTYELRAQLVDVQPGDEAGTPVNLTLHWGFNLSDFKNTSNRDALVNKLWLNSSKRLENDSRQVPTGKLLDTKGTDFDYRGKVAAKDTLNHTRLGDHLPIGGIDHNYILDSSADEPAAVVTSPKGDISIVFYTNQRAVQCYTMNAYNAHQSSKRLHGSEPYPKHGGIMLEFAAPNATFLNPELVKANGGDDTLLKPGQTYRNWTRVDVYAGDKPEEATGWCVIM